MGSRSYDADTALGLAMTAVAAQSMTRRSKTETRDVLVRAAEKEPVANDGHFEDEAVPVVMPAGSALFFLGTLWHGGGSNRSGAPRLAATCQYCEPYLRQQENFSLELSRDVVASLSPELQSLVGYSIFPPFMGMVDGKHPKRLLTSHAAAASSDP